MLAPDMRHYTGLLEIVDTVGAREEFVLTSCAALVRLLHSMTNEIQNPHPSFSARDQHLPFSSANQRLVVGRALKHLRVKGKKGNTGQYAAPLKTGSFGGVASAL